VFGGPATWGLGFALDGDDFGMGGLGGSYGGASRAGRYAFAFLTGTMGTHADANAVEDALRACLGLPPLEL
jgi:hypothetical protein